MLTVLRAVAQGGQQGVSASLGGMPAVSTLCLRDGAHAVLADLSVLWPPQGLRLVMQAFPLQAKLCTARVVEWAEFCGPAAHSELGGGNRGEVCGVAFLPAGARQGLCHDGEGAVYRFALGAYHRRANVFPRAAPGQVCNALLEAAVKSKPAVLVPQGECQELIH
jgi:hypothetical protein